MTTWTNDELNKIGTAEELKIASLRADGTLRKPVIIWVVRFGDVSTSNPSMDAPQPGFAACRHSMQDTFVQVAWRKMSLLWTRPMLRSTPRLIQHTAQSIAAMRQASSTASTAPLHEPQPSNLCRAQ